MGNEVPKHLQAPKGEKCYCKGCHCYGIESGHHHMESDPPGSSCLHCDAGGIGWPPCKGWVKEFGGEPPKIPKEEPKPKPPSKPQSQMANRYGGYETQ